MRALKIVGLRSKVQISSFASVFLSLFIIRDRVQKLNSHIISWSGSSIQSYQVINNITLFYRLFSWNYLVRFRFFIRTITVLGHWFGAPFLFLGCFCAYVRGFSVLEPTWSVCLLRKCRKRKLFFRISEIFYGYLKDPNFLLFSWFCQGK